MAKERREHYDRIRQEVEEWVWDYMWAEVQEFSSGSIALEVFGVGANSLDALCLMAVWENNMEYVLSEQVRSALVEGASWNAVADALGVSRQAAVKRFGPKRAPAEDQAMPEQRST